MSTEKIFGGWDNPTPNVDRYQQLWHQLAAQHVGTPEFKPHSGLSQRKHEIIMLWQLFSRQNPQVVLEIGTAQGGTFASWCQLSYPGTLLIAIDRCLNDCRPRPGDPVHPDIWDGKPLKLSAHGGGVYALGRPGQFIVGIDGWSHEPHVLLKLSEVLEGRKVDFMFHDASHASGMFAKDFQIYWPLVAEGGIFATHDVMPSKAGDCDKSVEWERIKREETYSAVYEFFSRPNHDDSMGIGVLIK